MSATATAIAAIIERSKPREPRKCHLVDHRGWALCGALGPRYDENGKRDCLTCTGRSECRARGHRRCVACDELDRQLGDDFLAA